MESFYSWVICLLAIKWQLLSVTFFKSDLKAILMLTLSLQEFCQFLLKLSGLWSIDSEIDLRKLLFLGRLLTSDKMALVVRNLFQIRSQSYFDANIVSLGVLASICEALHKYGLFIYFDSYFSDSVFPTYSQWK